jgi:hypothetical protein
MAQAAIAADVPGSVWAIGIAVAGALSGALALVFRLLLAEVAGRREDQKAATAAILAERAAAQATIQPLVDGVGKLATAVTDASRASAEQRDAANRLATAVDRQTGVVEKLWFEALQERRRSSSQTTPAVKP